MVRQQRRSRYGQSSRPQDLFEEKEEGQKRGRSRRQEEEEEVVAVSTESIFDLIDGNSKADRKARFFLWNGFILRLDARHGNLRSIGTTAAILATAQPRLKLLCKVFRLGWHFRFQSEG